VKELRLNLDYIIETYSGKEAAESAVSFLGSDDCGRQTLIVQWYPNEKCDGTCPERRHCPEHGDLPPRDAEHDEWCFDCPGVVTNEKRHSE